MTYKKSESNKVELTFINEAHEALFKYGLRLLMWYNDDLRRELREESVNIIYEEALAYLRHNPWLDNYTDYKSIPLTSVKACQKEILKRFYLLRKQHGIFTVKTAEHEGVKTKAGFTTTFKRFITTSADKPMDSEGTPTLDTLEGKKKYIAHDSFADQFKHLYTENKYVVTKRLIELATEAIADGMRIEELVVIKDTLKIEDGYWIQILKEIEEKSVLVKQKAIARWNKHQNTKPLET